MSEPERQLETARMIIATELGKDPQLRNKIREIFKVESAVTILPTAKGEERIDPYHPFHVCTAHLRCSEEANAWS
jgi:transcription elongation factor SPT6